MPSVPEPHQDCRAVHGSRFDFKIVRTSEIESWRSAVPRLQKLRELPDGGIVMLALTPRGTWWVKPEGQPIHDEHPAILLLNLFELLIKAGLPVGAIPVVSIWIAGHV